MEHNANHIILSCCHLPVSCRNLVDWCGSLGSCLPQIELFNSPVKIPASLEHTIWIAHVLRQFHAHMGFTLARYGAHVSHSAHHHPALARDHLHEVVQFQITCNLGQEWLSGLWWCKFCFKTKFHSRHFNQFKNFKMELYQIRMEESKNYTLNGIRGQGENFSA